MSDAPAGGPLRLLVTVPATSANLGPGFDSLGLAIDLRLTVRATVGAEDGFAYAGEGPAPSREGNLVHRGFEAAYAAAGRRAPPVALEVDNPVPLARGLGSSSAALVAGVAAADAAMGGALGRDGVFGVAAELEGHPDNVGPAVYGGFVVAARGEDGAFAARSFPVPEDWRLLFGVPSFAVPTAAARAALPATCALADAALTASRAALWVAAVATGDRALLRTASLDVIHQPHRARLVPGLEGLLRDLRAAGADAAYLSGAGPTVGAIAGDEALAACREVLAAWVGPEGRVLEPRPATGYAVTRC